MVVIKDMRMPSGCAACKLQRFESNEGGTCTTCSYTWKKVESLAGERPSNCPLAEVDYGNLDIEGMLEELDDTRYELVREAEKESIAGNDGKCIMSLYRAKGLEDAVKIIKEKLNIK